jgi:hypothetical protein
MTSASSFPNRFSQAFGNVHGTLILGMLKGMLPNLVPSLKEKAQQLGLPDAQSLIEGAIEGVVSGVMGKGKFTPEQLQLAFEFCSVELGISVLPSPAPNASPTPPALPTLSVSVAAPPAPSSVLPASTTILTATPRLFLAWFMLVAPVALMALSTRGLVAGNSVTYRIQTLYYFMLIGIAIMAGLSFAKNVFNGQAPFSGGQWGRRVVQGLAAGGFAGITFNLTHELAYRVGREAIYLYPSWFIPVGVGLVFGMTAHNIIRTRKRTCLGVICMIAAFVGQLAAVNLAGEPWDNVVRESLIAASLGIPLLIERPSEFYDFAHEHIELRFSLGGDAIFQFLGLLGALVIIVTGLSALGVALN